jgi:phosphoglycerate dehydrogenase-like enzyme
LNNNYSNYEYPDSFVVSVKANGKTKRPSIVFPSAARRMDTLNDLLAASDLVSLHCALTNDTMHILNADCLQHIKPGKVFHFFCNCVLCSLKFEVAHTFSLI